MINFNYETNFQLENEDHMSEWIESVITDEGYLIGEINYVFCDDDYLHQLNQKYLKHDTLTDVIGFKYSVGIELQGDIYISVDRVKENAISYNVETLNELGRVMVHGILHFCGYEDNDPKKKALMQLKEDQYLNTLLKIS